ncbi:MAG: 50S ribosomal protein L15 [Desulfofustis sp. PB-SRB1]|jgi:large subunit ribosomal protein L15|nr:50S ribosomal protein L15 [Desulfofustis sp. PB-SRB1]MBM1002441.1 50S ribosomal protein L15 [Desulfofustis sp. PB-SRB1]HBH30056.1 50S ribosomal protein L15 [Desulfofustis sp.]HBH31842.1 50S ribosomal protein L15 [Desulfofustis sp.]
MLTLANLSPQPGSRHAKKRIGRGPGSGHGKTAGKGHKGARARAGFKSKPGFEGGQMPLQRRLPKRGFTNPFKRVYAIVSLTQLEERFAGGQEITKELLVAENIVKGGMPVKILANGTVSKPFTVKVEKISAQARVMIEKAGGTVEEVS